MKSRRLTFECFVFLFFTIHLLNAQESWISEKAAPLASVALLDLELQDNQKLLAQSRSVTQKHKPLTFAKSITTHLESSDNGTWESLVDGQMLWRQRIRSREAYSLNLGFEEFYLPPSAKMFLYDAAKTYVIGPLTSQENEVHGEWWSPIIPSEEVVIEIQIDAAERDLLKTVLGSVQHDFSGFGNLLSGSCNVDIACGAQDDLAIIDQYRDIINSVGMYSVNGRDLCSGGLINNTANDCTPYFLTAQHCGVTQGNAATVVIYWNYQNSSCRAPGSSASGITGDGSRTQFNSGTQLIAEHDRTDFALLLLDDPVDPSFQPYFAGWDRTTAVQDTVLSIHHPNTEEKRISFDFDPSDPFTLDVFIRILNWDIGTTEGGSSGAPLFTRSGHIIGQLNGGLASCVNSNNTNETDDYDDYGMLALSWEGGGTPETRLKDWLDPLGQNVTQLNGRGCVNLVAIEPQQLEICTAISTKDTLDLMIVSGFEDGATITLVEASEGIEAVNILDDNISPSDASAQIEVVVMDVIPEDASVVIRISDGTVSDLYMIPVAVNKKVSEITTLNNPPNLSRGVSYELELSWTGDAEYYQLELSPNNSFDAKVIIVDNIEADSYLIRSLESQTTYYWRVRGFNFCGAGDVSSVFEFTTGDVQCIMASATDLSQAISDDLDTIVSALMVAETGTIVDVNVNSIVGTHTYVGDLNFLLTSPFGTEVQLLANACDDSDNFNLSFDDASTIINRPCPLTSSQSLRPTDPLSTFNGEESNGEWTLTVIDEVALDGGSLESWSLEVCVLDNQAFKIDPDTIQFCDLGKNPIQLSGVIGEAFAGDVTLSTFDSQGQELNVTYSMNPIVPSGSREFTITIPELNQLMAGESFFITATDGNLSTTESVYLGGSTPGRFDLLSPRPQETGVDLRPDLSWAQSKGADSYQIFVTADSNVSQIVFDTIIDATSLIVPVKLDLLTTYYWRVVAFADCISTSSRTFSFQTDMVDPTIDLSLQSMRLYPNPTEYFITIEKDELLNTREVSFEIINLQGQVLQQERLQGDRQVIPLENYEAGVYFIRFSSSEGIFTRSIIKL